MLLKFRGRVITIDGKRRVLLSGSIHHPRSTPGMWPDLIRKSKEGGLDAIETYVFWNVHEPVCHQYDFTGNLDLVSFSKPFKMKDFMLFFESVHTFVLNGTMEAFLFGCIICLDVRFELLMMFT
ncbi:hypothetical protein ACE6H2_020804 [Prunus campanulata]